MTSVRSRWCLATVAAIGAGWAALAGCGGRSDGDVGEALAPATSLRAPLALRSPDGGPAVKRGVAVIDATSTLRLFDGLGELLHSAAAPSDEGDLNGGGMALGPDGLYVTAGEPRNRVVAYDLSLVRVAQPQGAFGELFVPRGIAYDHARGRFWVGNGGAGVNVYDDLGGLLRKGGLPDTYGPSGVAYDADDGWTWVANYVGAPSTEYGVVAYEPSGKLEARFDYARQFVPPAHTEPYAITVCSAEATGGAPVVVVGFIDDGSGLGAAAVRSFTVAGAPLDAFDVPVTKPEALSCTRRGHVYVGDATGLYRTDTHGHDVGLPGPFAGLTPPIRGVLAGVPLPP